MNIEEGCGFRSEALFMRTVEYEKLPAVAGLLAQALIQNLQVWSMW